MNSSDWCENEKECSDSMGKRLRSSAKFQMGDEGPDGMPVEAARDAGGGRVIEFDREFDMDSVLLPK